VSVNAPITDFPLTWSWTEDIETTEYLNVIWSSVHRWPECDALSPLGVGSIGHQESGHWVGLQHDEPSRVM